MCAKANLSTAFLPDFVNKLQLKLQCGLKLLDVVFPKFWMHRWGRLFEIDAPFDTMLKFC